MRYLVFGMAALCIVTPAQANDFPGARVEANIGWDHVRGTLGYQDTAISDDIFHESRNTDGVVFGATAGYDIPIGGSGYVGVEGSFDLADNKKCEVVFGDDAACFKVKRNFAIGGRFGTSVSKRALVYLGIAYVNGKAKVSYEDNLDPSNNFSSSDSRDGYRLSGGVEVRLTGKVFTKLEYRYSDYNSYEASSGTESATLDFERHQVVTGVGVRF